MITFYNLGEYGRLGNQLYQYAALKSLGLRNNYVVKIPNLSKKQWHGQSCLLNNFNIEADYLSDQEEKKIKYMYLEKDEENFDENFFNIPDNTNIRGFFQNLKYFQDYKEQIIKEFTPKQIFLDISRNFLDNLKKDGCEIVSLHARRGDLLDVNIGIDANKIHNQDNIFDEQTIFGNYISKAISIFKNKNVKYLVFTGGKRTGNDEGDIKFFKKSFSKFNNFIVVDKNDPMFDFTTMSLCDHSIMSHFSSFGWWATFLNNKKNMIVTYPKNYFFYYEEEKNKKRISNNFLDSWISL